MLAAPWAVGAEGVDSSGLKPWQTKRVAAALRPALGYLHRLQRRMEQRGFPPQDPLYQLVARAYEGMHHLHIELHYHSYDGVSVGRGRPNLVLPGFVAGVVRFPKWDTGGLFQGGGMPASTEDGAVLPGGCARRRYASRPAVMSSARWRGASLKRATTRSRFVLQSSI